MRPMRPDRFSWALASKLRIFTGTKNSDPVSACQAAGFASFLGAGKGGRVLEAGCGGGWFGKYLPDTIEPYGIDIDPRMVIIAGKQEPAVIGDITALPYRNGSFIGIHCHHVLEHLENPGDALNEFSRVLSPGGRIIAEVPSKWYHIAYEDKTHKQFFTKESFKKLFLDEDFLVVGSEYCALEFTFVRNPILFKMLGIAGRALCNLNPRFRRNIRILAEKPGA